MHCRSLWEFWKVPGPTSSQENMHAANRPGDDGGVLLLGTLAWLRSDAFLCQEISVSTHSCRKPFQAEGPHSTLARRGMPQIEGLGREGQVGSPEGEQRSGRLRAWQGEPGVGDRRAQQVAPGAGVGRREWGTQWARRERHRV